MGAGAGARTNHQKGYYGEGCSTLILATYGNSLFARAEFRGPAPKSQNSQLGSLNIQPSTSTPNFRSPPAHHQSTPSDFTKKHRQNAWRYHRPRCRCRFFRKLNTLRGDLAHCKPKIQRWDPTEFDSLYHCKTTRYRTSSGQHYSSRRENDWEHPCKSKDGISHLEQARGSRKTSDDGIMLMCFMCSGAKVHRELLFFLEASGQAAHPR